MRSIRLIEGVRAVGSSGRWCGRRGPRVPFRLEQLPELVLCLGERHARHDWLEEAEHDELASLIGRDAAALEVEGLGLIDRSDRARMGGPAAVRLVDLERRDRDGPGLLRKVHPELAEEAVRPDRGRLDAA